MEHYRPASAMEPHRPTSGPVADTLSQTSEIPQVSSVHESDTHSQDIYQAYHPSLGPAQPNDIWQPYQPPEGPPPGQEEKITSPSSAPEVAQQFGFYHPQPQQTHRALSPALSQGSTNVGSYPGSPQLAASVTGGRDKEVAQTYTHEAPEPIQRQKKRICGVAAKVFWILLALLLLLLIGLGAGLGAGLGIKHHSTTSHPTSTSTGPSQTSSTSSPAFTGDPSLNIGGVIDPKYYSTQGAFNGSGIAFAGAALRVTNIKGLYTVYYQHYEGSIRWVQLQEDQTFIGGTQSEIVSGGPASNTPRNSTPISVVQYVFNDVATWNLFYIGNDSYVKQRTWTNTTNLWQDGPATAQNMQALDADSVGLQGCWYGSFYGDTEAKDFPTASGASNNATFADQHYGMHLWYASNANTFEQWGIYEGQTEWKHEYKFTGMNGHAGVGCYSWLPGDTTYAMFVNQYDAVEIWWKDTNTNLTSTDTHPINAWTNATNASIPNVYPSTSLGYTTYLYAMLADSTINGYWVNYQAENTSITAQITVSGSDGHGIKFLNGTHMTVSAVNASLLVFAQTKGDDISLYQKDNGGFWTSTPLSIDLP